MGTLTQISKLAELVKKFYPQPRHTSSQGSSFACSFCIPVREREEGVSERKASFTPTGEGFTLAEVLITLGIIGVVAALTLPTLIQNHANKVVETRLAKFYSAINQAITLAEVDYGDREYWYAKFDDLDTDIKGRPVQGKTSKEKWVNKYLAPYMKITETKYSGDYPIFYLADGGCFIPLGGGTQLSDWRFYTKDFFKCKKGNGPLASLNYGVCDFAFVYGPGNEKKYPGWSPIGRTFEPYKYAWDGTLNGIVEGSPRSEADGGGVRACNKQSQSYCALYIQYNGWKIPKDYPLKVQY